MPKVRITDQFLEGLRLAELGVNLFITGKAGTGKSTLLRLIKEQLIADGKIAAVLAPTGVAALNVEGETVHRFFGFRAGLSSDLREYRAPDRLVELDAILLDEVSMVRSDLFDMMDRALRRRRDRRKPFGGVQMILIGDLFQLPPVITETEQRNELAAYSSGFFFASRAHGELDYKMIELTEVFRQSDSFFIKLLNSLRDGSAGRETIEALNARVIDGDTQDDSSTSITLTATNKRADKINNDRLSSLGQEIFVSHAEVVGEVDPNMVRSEGELSFAVGARVMLLVNTDDYVNGSLGTVSSVGWNSDSTPRVRVRLDDSAREVDVEPYSWVVMRPRRQSGVVHYDEVGRFTQLPFRLAWAVTVHKSQGKTFEKVVFDRDRGLFAEGQLYVALSRCTSLTGLSLTREVRERDIMVSREAQHFMTRLRGGSPGEESEGFAAVGYVETGGGRFSKICELSVYLFPSSGSGKSLSITTLINPMRDLSEARETGLDASTVSLAPTLQEVLPFILRILSGRVIVTAAVTNFHKLLGWPEGSSESIGIDLLSSSDEFRIDPSMTAHDRMTRIYEEFCAQSEEFGAGSAFNPTSNSLQTPFWIFGRPGSPPANLQELSVELDLTQPEKQLVSVGLSVSGPCVEHSNREPVTDIAEEVFGSLLNAALRDGEIADRERELLTQFIDCWSLDVSLDDVVKPKSSGFEIKPGMRVCLTGNPADEAAKELLGKPALRAQMEKYGLVEVASVTKSKCDLVVAFNSSSLSGKAKKAREYGKPVLSADDFLERLKLLGG